MNLNLKIHSDTLSVEAPHVELYGPSIIGFNAQYDFNIKCMCNLMGTSYYQFILNGFFY